ncbi:MAG: RNA methyltransferase [Polyangiaceae bacterium]|nr:RNA methyltransferase [Polyangiaceae bacterium]
MKRDTEGVFDPGAEQTTPRPWDPAWTDEGVIAALEPLVLERRRVRLREVIAARLGAVTVLLDAPHDPHNGSAILRSCDAFGVQALHVTPREEAFLASRAVAQGTERWVDVFTHASPEAAARALAATGHALVIADAGGALLPEDLARLERVALVLGNEHEGVRPELRAAATASVRVPMRGFVESLNLSVTAGILLAAATRGRAGDLSPAQRRALYARGLHRTVPRAEDVLAALPPR